MNTKFYKIVNFRGTHFEIGARDERFYLLNFTL